MADIQRLIQQLADPTLARDAFKTLSELGATAVEPLLSALHDPNEGIRRQAIALLGTTRDARAIEPLIKLADDRSKQIQNTATAALGNFNGDARVADYLRQVARGQGEVDVRVGAIFALERVAGKAEVQALWLVMLDDASPQMIINAASQVATAKQAGAVERLTATLKRLGETDITFNFLIRALGDLGDKRAFETLVGYLQASAPQKRATVAHAIGQLGDVRGLAVLEALKQDKAVAGQQDHGGPQYTVGDMAQEAIDAIRKANNMAAEKVKSRWKFW